MIRDIDPKWRFAFDIKGGKSDCNHQYDEDHEYNETEYGGTYTCVHCAAVMTYDVSDIGD